MKRAYSVTNVLDAKFNTLDFDGGWIDNIRRHELTGSWMIYGHLKMERLVFAMMLAKYIDEIVEWL